MILPLDLIRTTRRKGRIYSRIVKEETLGLANTLIEVYKEHLNSKRRELKEALTSCENIGYNYRLVRGISAVLESYCIFQMRNVIDPVKARSLIFKEAGKKIITTEKERLDVLKKVSIKLDLNPRELEESLYADLEDEARLIDFDEPDPRDLLKRYNFALMVGLLAHSNTISITYRGSNSQILRSSKKLGNVDSKINGDTYIKIDLKPTRQLAYRASRIEELFSQLIKEDTWSVNASVTYPKKYKRSYLMEISKKRDGKWFKAPAFEEEIIIEIPERRPKKSSYGEIIVLESLAQKMGTTEKMARDAVLTEGVEFKDISGVLITPNTYNEISSALAEKNQLSLATAKKILNNHGCSDPLPVLEALGYTIKWSRPREESVVYRL